jgi:hypothetical protein
MLIPLDNRSFAEQEFGGLDLGDKRLNKRALKVGEMINGNPSLSFPEAGEGDKAELKAFYRFFQNADVTDQKLLETHYRNTLERCQACGNGILLVTDSTYLSPAKAETMKGLKDIGGSGKKKGNGLRIHYMIAVDERRGDVLGITDLKILGADLGRISSRLEDESDLWKWVGEETVKRIRIFFPEKEADKLISRMIYIADREGDDFDLFFQIQKLGLQFIIRSQYDRQVKEETEKEKLKISELADKEEIQGTPYEIEIREKNGSKRKTFVQRSVLKDVEILPPAKSTFKEEILKVNIIFVREINPPSGKTPAFWRLLTSCPVQDIKDSKKVVNDYLLRWKIEEFNKCAKTGVLLEERQFTTLENLCPVIAMTFVVAWRILSIRDISKMKDETPIHEVFSPQEVDYLEDKLSPLKEKILTVKQAVKYIAQEGGFLELYPHPGWIILWRGWYKFVLLVEGYTFAKQFYKIETRSKTE